MKDHSQTACMPGDLRLHLRVLALNDVRVLPSNLDERQREYHAGDRVTLTVFRNDELLRSRARLTDPPEDTWALLRR